MVYKKEILLLFACFFVASCNVGEFKQFKFNSGEYYFTFNQNIPNLLKEKIIFLNGSNTNNNEEKIEVNIIQYNLRTYEIYSGAALRAIEKEIKATLSFSVKENASMHMNHSMNMDHKMDSKSINVTKRFSAIELNPLAENQMIEYMEKEIVNDLIDQLILEVNLIDL